MILLGTGFNGRSPGFRKISCGLIIFLRSNNATACLVLRSCHRTLQSSSLSLERMEVGVTSSLRVRQECRWAYLMACRVQAKLFARTHNGNAGSLSRVSGCTWAPLIFFKAVLPPRRNHCLKRASKSFTTRISSRASASMIDFETVLPHYIRPVLRRLSRHPQHTKHPTSSVRIPLNSINVQYFPTSLLRISSLVRHTQHSITRDINLQM